MNNTTFENKRIYSDYKSHLTSDSRSKWSLFYKSILILFFATSILVMLFMAKASIFPEVYIGNDGDGWVNLFKFDDQYREGNAVILIRFSTLFFVFLFSIFKNYKNISKQKEKIKHYIFFYISYLLLSIASVALMFFYTYWNNPIETEEGTYVQKVPYQWNEILSLTFLLIPLLVINISFEVYNYIYKRKSEPLLYSSVISFIIQIISQFLLVVAIIAIAQAWINPAPVDAGSIELKNNVSGETEIRSFTKQILMFKDNQTWESIESLFTVKKATNLIIIIALFIAFGFLIVGSNIRSLSRLSEKNLLTHNNKDKYMLSITLC
ncbi:MSC_0624 family F1-like ATPase-associated membrane protein [Mycoplasma sp. CSL7503-lung]|uniref:MSC_0624 family F1-like ATPase-associated membrane protein n=1 Tax=Mycoplasma sp. CSL7503-lung TaxID=536372 RepID=UPI0021CFC6BF|nr:hypothetical protein [Mycoplasma sp. CSL7503-lung]MCU4706569.1 hypothetical protein [Mycoplasma sp. CSL7503-lung]